MVSFSCEACNDTILKKKLDQHRNQCRNAQFTCLDCNVTFQGTDYRAHTSCISEAQKYQGALFRGDKGKNNGRPQQNGRQQNGQQQQPRAMNEHYNRKATGANGAVFGVPRVLGSGSGCVKPGDSPEASEKDVEMSEAPAPAAAAIANGTTEKKVEDKKEKSEKKEKKDKKRKRDGEKEEKEGKKSKSSEDGESSSKAFKKLVKLAPKKGKDDMTFTEFLVEMKKDAALFSVFQELKVRRSDDGLVLFK